MAILINFFDNVILQAISEEIVPKVSFFKDRYFPTGAGDIFKANEVLTEYRSGDRKLAAFVDQKAGDIPIGRRSYEVHSYKPAYIAPSRLLTLDELTKRGFGEALYPGMDEAQRAARLLADDMNDMENRIARREEWMAAETMIGNGCVMQEYIDGATKGDSLVVKFYDGTSDHTYTASKKWNENGGDFWGDVKAIRRMYTNLSMGSKATDAQSAAFEQLGFTAEQFAKDMQKDAPAALKSLFTAIGTQPKDKQVGYLKTLLGQWAIESGAKLTGNLDLFVKTLDDVGDASKYNGSMYKEFMLKCETSESVLTMLGSAWRAVRIEVGNNFLPVLKDVAGFGIEKLNDLRAALPDIAERVRQVIEYLLNNGDKVATTIAGIGTAWAGMRFAPQILQVVSSATKFASGAASPVGLVQKGVSGAGKAGNLWQAAKLGTQLANSAVPAGSNPSFGQRVQNTILGSVLGMQNSKKLFGAKTPAGMAKATSALFGSMRGMPMPPMVILTLYAASTLTGSKNCLTVKSLSIEKSTRTNSRVTDGGRGNAAASTRSSTKPCPSLYRRTRGPRRSCRGPERKQGGNNGKRKTGHESRWQHCQNQSQRRVQRFYCCAAGQPEHQHL